MKIGKDLIIVGDYNINYPIILSPEEYKKLILVQDLKDYYKSKIDAAEGKKDGTDQLQKNLIFFQVSPDLRRFRAGDAFPASCAISGWDFNGLRP